MSKFGSLIRKSRLSKSITLKQFSDLLKGKVSGSFIQMVEMGKSTPGLNTINKICEVLEIDRELALEFIKKDKLKEYKEELNRKYK